MHPSIWVIDICNKYKFHFLRPLLLWANCFFGTCCCIFRDGYCMWFVFALFSWDSFFRFAGMSWYGLVGIYLIPISYYLSICNIWNFGRYDCLVLLHILDIIVSDLWVLMINMGCYSVLYLWDRCISFFWCILISLSVSFSLHHPYSRFRSPHHSPSCWSYRLKSEELILTSISSSLMVFLFGNG